MFFRQRDVFCVVLHEKLLKRGLGHHPERSSLEDWVSDRIANNVGSNVGSTEADKSDPAAPPPSLLAHCGVKNVWFSGSWTCSV